MKKIRILDCTLRDGGYVNNNEFGTENIKKTITYLEEAGIDIIECGYLKSVPKYNSDFTDFPDFMDLVNLDAVNPDSKLLYTLLMMGETYDIEDLPDKNQTIINALRLTFHRGSSVKGLEIAKKIKEKGYLLFLQPTATMRYSDEELLELIRICNEEVQPYALSLVDTFGEMKPTDVARLTKLFDENLDPKITLDFHSHNNMQLSYANAITFIENCVSDREIVIDSSIEGMGRGAGNLCTEVIVQELNENYNGNYRLEPILKAADEVIENIRKEKPWGYSLEYYLSAVYKCHPQYVIYYLSKKTLSINDINNLLTILSEDKKADFDKLYADELYFVYNQKNIDDGNSIDELRRICENKEIVILGPGSSILENSDQLAELTTREDVFAISINADSIVDVDAIFFGNKKRYEEKSDSQKMELLTSNIEADETKNRLIFDYKSLIATELETSDNSLLMLLKLLRKIGVSEVKIAGFDGYKTGSEKNYSFASLEHVVEKSNADNLNALMKNYLNFYNEKYIKIHFLTPSLYFEEGKTKCLYM